MVVRSLSKACNNALAAVRPARREALSWPLALLRFLPRGALDGEARLARNQERGSAATNRPGWSTSVVFR